MKDPIMKVTSISKKYKLLSNTSQQDTFMAVILNSFKSILTRKDNSSSHSEFWALKDINFTVNKGDRIGIIGHNGAGKSTLLKIFSKITVPTEGRIEVKGRISSLLEVGTGFHPELTGRENIYLNGSILGMSRSEIESKFNDIVEFSEIGDFLDTPVKRYSSGMYVRLAFAVAAHLDPDILIVDEVLAVGDMKFQEKCLGKMSEVSGEGRTVLYVSHNMSTVQQLCNRVIVMDHGNIVYDGEVDEGIKIYMENTKPMQVYTNLEEIKRFNIISGAATMLSVELLNKDDCIFDSVERMKYKLRWRANRVLGNVSLRMEILYADSTRVGISIANNIGNAKEGQVIENVFEYDISYLAPGKYIVIFVMYHINEYGVTADIDHANHAFSFEILQNRTEAENFTWLHRWWGHVKFPALKQYQ